MDNCIGEVTISNSESTQSHGQCWFLYAQQQDQNMFNVNVVLGTGACESRNAERNAERKQNAGRAL